MDETPDVTVAGRSLQLPLFEGERPTGTSLSLNGSITRLMPGMHMGERFFLLVECEITEVAHARKKGQVQRGMKATIDDAFLLEFEEAQYRVSELEEDHRAAVDSAMGRVSLLVELGADEDGVLERSADSGDAGSADEDASEVSG